MKILVTATLASAVLLGIPALLAAQSAPSKPESTQAAPQAPPPAPAASSSGSGWDVDIYPLYGWAPIYGADVKLPCANCGGDGSIISDVKTSGDLNGAYSGAFWVKKGRVAAQGEILWAGLSGSRTTPNAEISADTTLGRLMGAFELTRGFFVEAGVRHVAVKFELTAFDFEPVSWKPGFWDPTVGALYRGRIARKWLLVAEGDFGGLGGGDDRTASLTGRAEWAPARHFSLTFGYGFLYIHTKGTVRNTSIELSQTLNGPILGIGIPF